MPIIDHPHQWVPHNTFRRNECDDFYNNGCTATRLWTGGPIFDRSEDADVPQGPAMTCGQCGPKLTLEAPAMGQEGAEWSLHCWTCNITATHITA
jgi:hypothetical protein